MQTAEFQKAIVVEAAGTPEVLILHQFMGLRIKYEWQFPPLDLEKIGAGEILEVGDVEYGTKQVACVLGCPIVWGKGYRVYRVAGHVADFKVKPGPTTKCLDPEPANVPANPTEMP